MGGPGYTPSGYVLDGHGTIHTFGPAPGLITDGAYWSDASLGKALAAVCLNGEVAGYMLDGDGGMHPFYQYGSPAIGLPEGYAYWPGWNIARGLVLLATDQTQLICDPICGYTLDGFGGIHPFGGQYGLDSAWYSYWNGWDIARALVITATSVTDSHCEDVCGYTLDGWGGVHSVGLYNGSTTPWPPVVVNRGGYFPGNDIVRAIGAG
ncbi:MAG: hypothetical protein JOY68_05940 [Candidatus Dormibacteraeota bacterium]|nr:hypothetical protein [Candidatus Dormibacteraeota bacterium]